MLPSSQQAEVGQMERPPPSKTIYLHGPPAPRSPAWMGAVDVGGAVLAFAPAGHADANGLTQESRLDRLFQS